MGDAEMTVRDRNLPGKEEETRAHIVRSLFSFLPMLPTNGKSLALHPPSQWSIVSFIYTLMHHRINIARTKQLTGGTDEGRGGVEILFHLEHSRHVDT